MDQSSTLRMICGVGKRYAHDISLCLFSYLGKSVLHFLVRLKKVLVLKNFDPSRQVVSQYFTESLPLALWDVILVMRQSPNSLSFFIR